MVSPRTGVTKAGHFDTAYIWWRHWLIHSHNGTPSTLEATSRRSTTRMKTLAGLHWANRGWSWSKPVAGSMSRLQRWWTQLPSPMTAKPTRSRSRSWSSSQWTNSQWWRLARTRMTRTRTLWTRTTKTRRMIICPISTAKQWKVTSWVYLCI